MRIWPLLIALLGCTGTEKEPDTGDPRESTPLDDTACADGVERGHPDRDDDGYGDGDEVVEGCGALPEGAVRDGTDCDDGEEDVHPGAADACEDGVDGDCDGADEACAAEPSTLADATCKLVNTARAGDGGRHLERGDLNGDGVGDVVVGEMWARGYEGGAIVLYGPVEESGELPDLGVEIQGGDGSFEGGRSMGVGDVNRDGYDDLLLGSPDASAHDAVLFFGPVEAGMDFSDADVLTACSEDVECGHGSDVADVDGDGVMDAIIGAGEERNSARQQTGAVYLLFGPLDDEDLDLRSESDAEIQGVDAGSEAGRVLVGGGDLDGDGLGDLLITSGEDSDGGPSSGAVYVLLAPVADSLTLDEADGKLTGGSSYSYAGEALAMGDISGDGLVDAIVGAPQASGGDGAVSVVLGPATGTISLSDAEATLRGLDEMCGASLSSADLDGDEAAELLVGASNNGEGGRATGAAYLLRGPLEGELETSAAEISLLGEARRDQAGGGVLLADATGDGVLDLLIGAPGESSGSDSAGALYVFAR